MVVIIFYLIRFYITFVFSIAHANTFSSRLLVRSQLVHNTLYSKRGWCHAMCFSSLFFWWQDIWYICRESSALFMVVCFFWYIFREIGENFVKRRWTKKKSLEKAIFTEKVVRKEEFWVPFKSSRRANGRQMRLHNHSKSQRFLFSLKRRKNAFNISQIYPIHDQNTPQSQIHTWIVWGT